MKKPHIVGPLLIIVAVAAFSSLGVAQRATRGPHRGIAGPGIARLAEALNLTAEQKTTIEDKEFAARKSAIEMHSKIEVTELELRRIMLNDEIDEQKVKSAVEQIGKLKTDLRLLLVQTRLDIMKVLTADQKEKWHELRQERWQQFRRNGMEGRGTPGFRRPNWHGRGGGLENESRQGQGAFGHDPLLDI